MQICGRKDYNNGKEVIGEYIAQHEENVVKIPFFSVILPIYNVAAYLERCVDSILKQDFQDYEMILVDDGSTDQSSEICDKLAMRYECIRVIHKQNGGLSSARNAGLEIARGQYIWWVDSDDWIEEGALSLLYHVVSEKRPDIVKFNHVRVAEEKTVIFSNAVLGDYQTSEQKTRLMHQAFLTTSKYILSAWSHVYSREFLNKNMLTFVSERQIGSEDYLFNLQALLCAKEICVLEEPLYYYEQRMGSLTQRYKFNSPQRYTELYRRLREYYQHAGVLSRYERWINTFYVWHLLHGICIPNEYYVSDGHSLAEGRKNITDFLKLPEFQKAAKQVDTSRFSHKAHVQLLAMRWCIEPLFYWLYVVKKRRLKG